jgi:subtilisin family serine protease
VSYVEPDFVIAPAAIPNDPSFGSLWGLHNSGQSGGVVDADIDAPEAWDTTTGSRSVVIAVIDTGVDYTHRDLAANAWRNPGEIAGDGLDNDGNGFADDVFGWDFANRDANPMDDNGHGTHVAGTIGAVGGNGTGVVGVNWQVSIMALKFLSGTGSGSTSGAIGAINYATRMRRDFGVNVVATNNPWGGGGFSASLRDAIEAGGRAGILFVAAAGNNASNNDATANYPSNYSTLQGTTTTTAASSEGVIAVAALDSSGNLASYSNYGSGSVDIGAPGSAISSTLPGGTYGAYSGTSMATPHVTGTVALYAAAYPGSSANTIRSAILSTARPTASLSGKTATGGRLDAAAALNAAPPVGITIVGGSVAEGNSGTTALTFTITLASPAAATVTVNYATANGTATAGGDYLAQSGVVSFSPGETSKTITVNVVGDTAFESNETLSIALSGASANARIQTGTATGTIFNDDLSQTPTLSIASAAAVEKAGALVFTVTLSAASSSSVSVRFSTVAGTAKAGRNGDFSATSGTLTFAPGETSKTVSVRVQDDSAVEANETLFVSLSRASGASIMTGTATGTILDDDGVAAARVAAFAALAAADPPTTRPTVRVAR